MAERSEAKIKTSNILDNLFAFYPQNMILKKLEFFLNNRPFKNHRT